MQDTNTQQKLIDLTIAYIISLERYKNGQVVISQRDVRKTYSVIVDYLKRNGVTNESKKDVMAFIYTQMKNLGVSVSSNLYSIAFPLSQLEKNFLEMAAILYVSNVNVTGLSKSKVEEVIKNKSFLGGTLPQNVSRFVAAQNKKFRDQINQDLKDKTEKKEIISGIQKLLDSSLAQVDSFTRTSIAFQSSTFRTSIIDANPETYRGYLYVAVLDNRTTILCRSRNGKIYNNTSDAPIPAHWNCRSHYAPILRFGPDISIADYNKEVDPSEYLRRQPIETIQKILGLKRAALFINGDLDLEDFLKSLKKSDLLTLEQLAKKFPGAFNKAGLS
jgi:SPP1 gp7 family putative phage head morphogenesis protein